MLKKIKIKNLVLIITLYFFQSKTIGQVLSMDNNIFNDVKFDTWEQNICSPKIVDYKWNGIQINVPSKIIYNKILSDVEQLTIPICGFYNIKIAKILDNKPIYIYVKDIHNNTIYEGSLIQFDKSTDVYPLENDEIDLQEFSEMSTSSFFNINLNSYVKLPVKETTFLITVKYGEYFSNDAITTIVIDN